MPRLVLQDELHDLRQQLVAPPPMAAPAASAPPPGAASPLETQIKALSDALVEMSDDAEGNIKRHPLAAVAAAFLLGFMAGRTTGRF